MCVSSRFKAFCSRVIGVEYVIGRVGDRSLGPSSTIGMEMFGVEFEFNLKSWAAVVFAKKVRVNEKLSCQILERKAEERFETCWIIISEVVELWVMLSSWLTVELMPSFGSRESVTLCGLGSCAFVG